MRLTNGNQLTGYWDGDDVVKVTQRDDVGTLHIGADGEGLFSQHLDYSVEIMIKLQPTSPMHGQLIQQWKQQREGNLNPAPFTLEDTQNNDGGSAEECYIAKAPDEQKGKVATVREWTLVAAKWDPTDPAAGA